MEGDNDKGTSNADNATFDNDNSSLSLSLTPPQSPNNNNNNKPTTNNTDNNSDDISEHINSEPNSENDRSLQEIEIDNLLNLNDSQSCVNISQEIKPAEFTLNSNDSGHANIKSILDEILNNDQLFDSHHSTDVDNNERNNTSNNGNSLLLSNDFNVFANVDFEDEKVALYDEQGKSDDVVDGKDGALLLRKLREMEEILAVKESTIVALHSELDSFRENSNNTVSFLSTTEYKQLQDEFNAKILEYNNAIYKKDNLIQQLSDSFEESLRNRKDLLCQIDVFKLEIANLQQQLKSASDMLLKTNQNDGEDLKSTEKSDFPDSLENQPQSDLKPAALNTIPEGAVDMVPASALCDLKRDMEERHAQEMSELRQYFERKCADLEKNYSEEIFSQHSRKMSDSSDHDVNSDAIYLSSPVKTVPGPAGDVSIDLSTNFTASDVAALKSELSKILASIDKYDIDNLTDDDLDSITVKVNQCNFNVFLKYDLTAVKKEIQRKFDADLAMIRNDFDSQLSAALLDYEQRVKSLEQRHLEDIDNLNKQLVRNDKDVVNVVNAHGSIQEVSGGASGDFEITEVIQSYERRLQEQVALAKVDILNALQCQIQELAENERMDDDDWPEELVQLRNQFKRKYERRIEEMEQRHQEEVRALKAEHVKIMGGALERARRQSLKDSLEKSEMELIKERDILKKQSITLRHLLAELLKYFTQCEDALNATLVDELIKTNLDRSLDESVMNESSTSSGDTSATSVAKRRRVHLTPNFQDIIALIESTSKNDDSIDDIDISMELQTELSNCLQQVRRDANDILLMTVGVRKQDSDLRSDDLGLNNNQLDSSAQNPNDSNEVKADSTLFDSKNQNTSFDNSINVTLDRSTVKDVSNLNEKINSLTRQLINEVQEKNQLKLELDEAVIVIKALESEKVGLDRQLDELIVRENHLVSDLAAANTKIAELIESGHREIVSEGYGEQETKESRRGAADGGDQSSVSQLAELQEEARAVLAQMRKTADAQLLRLLEELCHVGEAIKEEAKRERADLQQQIKAADNKYKSTQKFLEEQTVEREMERDEAQRRIEALQEQLKGLDRDKITRELISSQVEQYENQVHYLQQRLDAESAKYKELESERNEAVDKIKELRDIIRELESQIESKSLEIEKFIVTIERLQSIIENQSRESDGESVNPEQVQQLKAHIAHLESEAEELRIAAEFIGSEGCAQTIRNRLLELEIAIDKKTKVLESLFQNSNNSCSSPSEDISVRELLNPSIYDSELVHDSEIINSLSKTRPKSAKITAESNRRQIIDESLKEAANQVQIDYQSIDNKIPKCNQQKSALKSPKIAGESRQIIDDLIQTTANQAQTYEQSVPYLDAKNNKKKSVLKSSKIASESRQIVGESRTNTPESQRISCESLESDSDSSKLDDLPLKSQQIVKKSHQINDESLEIYNDLNEITLESTGDDFNNQNQSIDIGKSPQIVNKKMSEIDRKIIDADCQVPLQQLARLKDKLLRHSRAEDSAIKRIRDLEMQVFHLRTELEESQNDREYLKNSVQEQLVLISDLQIRLDEQRIRAEHIEKCANTSLESKIFDLQNEVIHLEDKLSQKEKTVISLEKKLAETQQRIRDLENDPIDESDLVVAMQQELEKVRKEYDFLKYQCGGSPTNTAKVIEAKNAEIKKLENELKFYRDLNLNRNDLKNLSSLKGSSLLEGLSLIELSNSEVGRRAAESNKSAELSTSFFPPRKTEEISSIQSPFVPLMKPNSTEIYRTSGGKRVHFADDTEISFLHGEVSEKSEIDKLNTEIKKRDETIKDLQDKLKFLNQLEEKIANLQKNLEQTESALEAATRQFESEQSELLNEKNRLQNELDLLKPQLDQKLTEISEKDEKLSELNNKIELLNVELQRKEEMYLEMLQKLRHEKQEVESELATFKTTAYKNLDCVLKEKNAEIDDLKMQLENKMDQALIAELEEKVEELENELTGSAKKLTETQESLSKVEKDLHESEKVLTEKDKTNIKLQKELEAFRNDHDHVREKLHRKRKLINDLESRIKTLEALTEQLKSENTEYRSLVTVKNSELDVSQSEVSRKDAEMQGKANEIEKLQSELNRLQDLVAEKEKIIEVMTADSNQLHNNLVTINNKLQEIGNIVDLGKLKEERKKYSELLAENHELRTQILSYQFTVDSDLQRHLSEAEEKIRVLQTQLEQEREMLRNTQLEDIKLIEQLRIQLNAAADKEEALSCAVNEEKRLRSQLENQMDALKVKLAQPTSEKTDSVTEYKSYAVDSLEINELRKQLLTEQEDNLNLLQEIKEVKQERNETKLTLDFVKNQLALENERTRKLTEKVEQLLAEIGVVRQELVDRKLDFDRKARECAEMEMKIARLVHEKTELESKTASFEAVRHQLLDNVRMAKELYLNSRETASAHHGDNNDLTAKLIADRKSLERQLTELERSNRKNLAEVLERNDYLFAKTLKLESLKKNLIWQKRYLTKYLNCHERYCNLASAAPLAANDLGAFTWKPSKSRRFSKLNRFRAAVYSVIAIARMKIIVRRWEAKAAAIEHLNARHRSVSNLMERHERPQSGFRVGQPVNHLRFSTNPFRTGELETSGSEEGLLNTPWSGNTPPSKERTRRRQIEAGLQAPQLLAQFADRVERIQERLGVATHTDDV